MSVVKLAKELDFEAVKYSMLWAYPKDLEKLTNRSRSGVGRVKQSFREFLDRNPRYFEPYFKAEHVILEIPGETVQFNLLCFIHYYQNRVYLDAGVLPSRPFYEDLKYIKELLKVERV